MTAERSRGFAVDGPMVEFVEAADLIGMSVCRNDKKVCTEESAAAVARLATPRPVSTTTSRSLPVMCQMLQRRSGRTGGSTKQGDVVVDACPCEPVIRDLENSYLGLASSAASMS